jgi:aminopeptidase I
VAKDLEKDGYKKLSERDAWDLKAGGKYYVARNGTSLIAFAIGEGYKSGNGAAIVAGHIDALTAKLKPIPKLRNKAGYVQLGVAPYAGALSDTWWDRDLGIGGRVLVKEDGKIVTKLVKLDWPIARIPTLAPHFGAAANGPFNKETQMVPIIGLDNSDFGSSSTDSETDWKASVLGGETSFAATQPERLVKAIAGELSITDCTLTRCPINLHMLTINRLVHRQLGTRALRRPARHNRRSRPRVHLRRPHRRQALQLGRHPSPP